MRRFDTEVLNGIHDTVIDQPVVFDVTLPDGRRLEYADAIANTPVVTSEYDAITNPQLVLATDSGSQHWDEHTHYPVGRLDHIHGRTLEVLADEVDIEDQYGNSYTSLNVKGVNLTDPHFFKTLTAAREYIIHGLQESLVMERVLKASQVLRENNVDTEYICGLVLPKKFPIDRHPNQGIDDKQDVNLSELLEHMASEFAARQTDHNDSPLQTKVDMIERFQDCDYLVTYRAMDCQWRFGELRDPKKYAAFRDFAVKHAADEKTREQYAKKTVDEYMHVDFPYRLAGNMAKMHLAGIAHKHPVALNVTATGGIVDLDSCHGETLGLGDKPIAIEDEIHDVHQALSMMREEINELDFGHETKTENDYRRLHVAHTGATVFLGSYAKTRFNTSAEMNEFFVRCLKYQDSERKDEIGPSSYDLASDVRAAYSWVNDYATSAKPRLDQPLDVAPINRTNTFLRALPPSYLEEMKGNILDFDWVIEGDLQDRLAEEYGEGHKERPVLAVLARAVTFDSIVRNLVGDESKSNPDELLAILSAFFYEEDKATTAAVDDYFADHMRAIVDKLAAPDISTVANSTLKQMLSNKLQRYQDRLAQIHTIGENEDNLFVDVLYLKNIDEYKEVLGAYHLGSDAPLISMTPEQVAAADLKAQTNRSPILLADYRAAEHVSECVTIHEILGSLLKPEPHLMPTLSITTYDGERAQVNVLPLDEQTLAYQHNLTVRELLKDVDREALKSFLGQKTLFRDERLKFGWTTNTSDDKL